MVIAFVRKCEGQALQSSQAREIQSQITSNLLRSPQALATDDRRLVSKHGAFNIFSGQIAESRRKMTMGRGGGRGDEGGGGGEGKGMDTENEGRGRRRIYGRKIWKGRSG